MENESQYRMGSQGFTVSLNKRVVWGKDIFKIHPVIAPVHQQQGLPQDRGSISKDLYEIHMLLPGNKSFQGSLFVKNLLDFLTMKRFIF